MTDDCQIRIQQLRQEIDEFQCKHSLILSEIVETENYRLRVNTVIPAEEILQVQKRLGVTFPPEYLQFLTSIGNGLKAKYSSLLPLAEAVRGSHWAVHVAFPYTETWNPEYQGPLEDDSPETLGTEEYKRRQDWMLWWGDNSHMNGTLLLEDMGCGYYRHLVLNGPQRGYLWEDLRAADEGITPTTLHRRPVTFLDFYEHEIRYNLRGLDHEL